MLEMKKIIGLSGVSGSGKDLLANYLQDEFKFIHLSFGSIIRDLARKQKIKLTRQNLLELGDRYVKRNGKTFFCNYLLHEIEERNLSRVTINGIRNLWDYHFFNSLEKCNFTLIYIDVEDQIRFQRIIARGTEIGITNYDDFKKAIQLEHKMFDYDELRNLASIRIANNGSIPEFQQNVLKYLPDI